MSCTIIDRIEQAVARCESVDWMVHNLRVTSSQVHAVMRRMDEINREDEPKVYGKRGAA